MRVGHEPPGTSDPVPVVFYTVVHPQRNEKADAMNPSPQARASSRTVFPPHLLLLVRTFRPLTLAHTQEETVETPTGRGRASSFSSSSTPPSSSSATSATPCTPEQPPSLSAKLGVLEVAADDDDDDDDDDDEDLIIIPKDLMSGLSTRAVNFPHPNLLKMGIP